MTIPHFTPTFENGGYWSITEIWRGNLKTFLEFVPYLSGNENTYSFRLANLILAIGAHIDSAFKEMARYPEFLTKYPLILDKTRTENQKIQQFEIIMTLQKNTNSLKEK